MLDDWRWEIAWLAGWLILGAVYSSFHTLVAYP